MLEVLLEWGWVLVLLWNLKTHLRRHRRNLSQSIEGKRTARSIGTLGPWGTILLHTATLDATELLDVVFVLAFSPSEIFPKK